MSIAFNAPFLPTSRNTLRRAVNPLSVTSFSCPITPRAVLTPSLHTADSPENRQEKNDELTKNQQLYVYKSPPTIPGIAFIEGPPSDLPGQSPTRRWKLCVAIASFKVFLNFTPFRPRAICGAIQLLYDILANNLNHNDGLRKIVNSFDSKVDSAAIAVAVAERWKNSRMFNCQFEEESPILAPYRDMWKVLDLPPIANVFLEDKMFARLRVAGFNPISLQRVRTPDHCPFEIADSDLPNVDDSVHNAISENRLYFLDYSAVAGIQQQTNSNKVFTVCSAMFVVPPGGGDLAPVAICVDGDVFCPPKPNSPPNTCWAIAKMALNNCDAIHHELVAHLGRTHLLVEPFVAATMRQLPSDHPLHILLKPHFEGTVFINDTASKNLVAPGGDVDRIFAGEIESVMAWCGDVVVNNKFNASMPDVEMETRGVMDPILYMPYRDDALEHFEAMNEWVYAYLSHFYQSDGAILADKELQNWAKELVDPSCGRLKDFGEDGKGKLTTVKYLARAVTFVIFSGSVQHAAVNFPQMAYMSYAPALGGGLWGVPPKSHEPSDINNWASMLTPIKTAVDQVKILAVIGGIYYTQLGRYGRGAMPADPEIQAALRKYQARLAQIDKRIEARERNSSVKYDFMRPSKVPQSINI